MGCPQENEKKQHNSTQIESQNEPQSIGDLLNDINNLIADKSCQTNSDCALIALGARACGGPNSYEVYAKNNIDTEKLNSLAYQLETLEKKHNLDNQVVSICMVEPKPSIGCVQNQCQKQASFTELK